MLETLLRPDTETYAHQKLWTREECDFLVESGRLEERYELIEGTIYYKMAMNAAHRIALMLLYRWLIGLFDVLSVQTEKPISIPGENNAINAPLPDAAVTRQPTTAYTPRHPGPADISLIVEVSDSTLRLDLNVKARLYALAGIAEYWVMDIAGRQIYRHRQPNGVRYEDIFIFGENEMIAAPGRSETVRVGELFAPVSTTTE